jgi:hypothetical protein
VSNLFCFPFLVFPLHILVLLHALYLKHY